MLGRHVQVCSGVDRAAAAFADQQQPERQSLRESRREEDVEVLRRVATRFGVGIENRLKFGVNVEQWISHSAGCAQFR